MIVFLKILRSRAVWAAFSTLVGAIALNGFDMSPEKVQIYSNWIIQLGSILSVVLGAVAFADRLAPKK